VTPTELAVRPVGDHAFLVEVAENRTVHLLAAAARDRYGDEVEEVVPGEETLLLCWRGRPPALADLADALCQLDLAPARDQPLPTITIPVRYDGPDLEAVAATAGVDVDRVVELHSQPEYLVAFMGFAPGFAYLTGGSPTLELPRRDDPRPQVPAGSVAIASTYTAVYPTRAPGGWHLLGHTDAVLFDPERDPPALLEAGMRVVFDPR
jgi:KipI family sensor histidine kinase inhibitor